MLNHKSYQMIKLAAETDPKLAENLLNRVLFAKPDSYSDNSYKKIKKRLAHSGNLRLRQIAPFLGLRLLEIFDLKKRRIVSAPENIYSSLYGYPFDQIQSDFNLVMPYSDGSIIKKLRSAFAGNQLPAPIFFTTHDCCNNRLSETAHVRFTADGKLILLKTVFDLIESDSAMSSTVAHEKEIHLFSCCLECNGIYSVKEFGFLHLCPKCNTPMFVADFNLLLERGRSHGCEDAQRRPMDRLLQA